jgi:hypothetical protein
MKTSDWMSLALYGRPSLDYQNNADRERNVKVLDTQDKIAKKNLVQIGVDAEVRGGNDTDVSNAVRSAIERKYFESSEEYYDAVAKAKINQLTTARERDAADEGIEALNRMRSRYKMDSFTGQ